MLFFSQTTVSFDTFIIHMTENPKKIKTCIGTSTLQKTWIADGLVKLRLN